MAKVCPRVPAANATTTIGIQRQFITGIARLFDRNFSLGSEQQPVARGSRGQHAVHHVNTQISVLDNLLWGTDPHQVSRLVLWKMRDRCLNSLSRERPWFTDTQAANGVPRESNVNDSFCRFSSYLGIHSSLHDAEQSLSAFGCGQSRFVQ